MTADKPARITDCKHDACERRAQAMSAERVAKGKPPLTEATFHIGFEPPAPRIVAERGYCYSCGILGAPKFYHDAAKCRALGHDVCEVTK